MFSVGNTRNANLKNLQQKLDKLEMILLMSSAHNKHKPNYNSAAVLLMRNLKPKFNKWFKNPTDPYYQIKLRSLAGLSYPENRFKKQFGIYASLVNQGAVSKFASQVLADPKHMSLYFKQVNRAATAPALVPTRSPAPNNRSRSTTPNASSRYPNSRSRSTTPNASSRYSNAKIRTGQCTFKKLSAWGTPICK